MIQFLKQQKITKIHAQFAKKKALKKIKKQLFVKEEMMKIIGISIIKIVLMDGLIKIKKHVQFVEQKINGFPRKIINNFSKSLGYSFL